MLNEEVATDLYDLSGKDWLVMVDLFLGYISYDVHVQETSQIS